MKKAVATTRPIPIPPRMRMIDAAIELMRRSGLAGAGINEIVSESGAPKGSVYHFFPGGKEQLASEALGVHSQRVLVFVDAALSRKRSPPEKVKALFDAFAFRLEEGDFRQSCPFGTVCLDLETELDGLRTLIAAAFADWTELIARHFTFRDTGRAKSFARLLLTTIEGAYIRGRAERSGKPFREAGAWLAELAAREKSD